MDIINLVLGYNGLAYLVLVVFIAGLVRGFSGFGTAMVFIPIASGITNPVSAIIILLSFDLLGPLPLLGRAWRDGKPKEVAFLGVGALLGLPIGVYFLTRMQPELFRWFVSILAILMLVLLASGWRYRKVLGAWGTSGVGIISGFMTGFAALPGPAVIVTYMSSPYPPQIIRGNIMMYLFLVDILTLIVFALNGILLLIPILVGVFLALPYAIGGIIGQRIFDPDNEKFYRYIAYTLIALSAVIGLPIWG